MFLSSNVRRISVTILQKLKQENSIQELKEKYEDEQRNVSDI